MFDLDKIQEIWITISRNKLRSFLTAFGVLWGIFMLTIMIGTGNGLKRGFVRGIDGFANNSCFIFSAPTSIAYQGFQKGRIWNIRNKDLKLLADSIPEIDIISPLLQGPRYINNIVSDYRTSTFSIRGVYPNYAEIERQNIPEGRFINELDIKNNRKVCVIGSKVYEELFPNQENAVDQDLRVNGVIFKIIGVTYSISEMPIGESKLEYSIIVPLTTLQLMSNQGDYIQSVCITSKSNVPVSYVEEQAKALLKKEYRIHPDDYRATWSINAEEEFNLFSNLFAGIDILIWIVGSGTLIAGIIGISNIMVVTIRERTREIGIRRALGAKPRSIINQILMESLVLTSLAGLPGLCIGVYSLYIADKYLVAGLDNVYFYKPMITFDVAIVSLIILIICGLLAGLIPANRAMNINTIDAIRSE